MGLPQQTTQHASVCPLDCPDTCSLSVTVQNDTIVQVRGSKANAFTNGVVCKKVTQSYAELVHGDARLHHPLRRVGPKGSGRYEPISWADAIDAVYEGFQPIIEQYGGEAILPLNYAGPHGELAGGSMDRRFFHRIGATLLDRGPLCGGVRGAAYQSLFGSSPGMPPEQAVSADLIIVWGNNVTVSNLHFANVIKRAREQGAKLIVIDSKRIQIAARSDLYIQIRPGSDVVFAMAVAAELERRKAFDEGFIQAWVIGVDAFMAQARQYDAAQVEALCGIDEETFHRFVDLYVAATTVTLSIGNGIERGKSGGSGIRAAMALQALMGQFARPGAGVIAKPGAGVPKTSDRLQRPDLIPEGTRVLNILDVAQLMQDKTLDVPIKGVMIYNHNPVCTHPDQSNMINALMQEDLFIVGSDLVMTDSLRYADIILPACSHFEHDDIFGAYGQNYLQRAEAVIPHVGESLPNTEIFRRLAARFGFDEPLFTADDHTLMNDAIDATSEWLEGQAPAAIPTDKALAIGAPGGQEAIMCKTIFPSTPSGKIELYSAALETDYGYGVPRFESVVKTHPWVLITPSSEKRTNATFGHCEASSGIEDVEIHPDDAASRGITEGEHVILFNDQAEVVLRAKLTSKVQPGVLYSAKGTWLRSSASGRTVNALIDVLPRTDIASGACYNDTFVDISKVPTDSHA